MYILMKDRGLLEPEYDNFGSREARSKNREGYDRSHSYIGSVWS